MRISEILLLLGSVAVALAQYEAIQEKIATPQNEIFYINEPKQFARVLRSFMHVNSDDLICQAIDRETFTRVHAVYRLSDYLPDSPSAHWPTQIVSAARLPRPAKLYAALSTGAIIETDYRTDTVGTMVESRRWELEGSNGSWVDFDLVPADDKLVGVL